MSKNYLLQSIEKFFTTAKQDIAFMESEIRFKDALKDLDAEVINEIVEKGFSISEFEEVHGSTLMNAMTYSLDIMLSLFKKYWPEEYIKYYYEAYPRMSNETLPEPLRKELESVTKRMILTMDTLYANGADINKRGIPSQSYIGGLLGKTKIVGNSSPFEIAIQGLDYFKRPDVILWFTQKNDFHLSEQKGVVSNLIKLDSTLSTQVLGILLQNGLQLESYQVSDEINRYSSLHECIAVGGNQTRDEKFKLLYQAATPEQKLQYNRDYEIMMSKENETTHIK